jgi:hypothetical protein
MTDQGTAVISRRVAPRRGVIPRNRNAVEIIAECGWMPWTSEGSLDLTKCAGTWITCMNRIRRWRVPPRWLVQDWFEEMHSESVVAVLEALIDFDPAYGVPLSKFVGMRIQSRAIARYRKEWTYSIHQVFGESLEKGKEGHNPVELALKVDLRWGLSHLAALDRLILEQLFWGGETELNVAHSLGVSQQWVNKRKNLAIAKLRKMIAG